MSVGDVLDRAQALEALAVRCERAQGPDRELDRDIAESIGMCTHRHQTRNGCQSDWGYDCDNCGADSWGNRSKDGFSRRLSEAWPAYSASLDAAMTLKPEGCTVSVHTTLDSTAGAQVHHYLTGAIIPMRQDSARGATPALALTAAALRAAATLARSASLDGE